MQFYSFPVKIEVLTSESLLQSNKILLTIYLRHPEFLNIKLLGFISKRQLTVAMIMVQK